MGDFPHSSTPVPPPRRLRHYNIEASVRVFEAPLRFES
jgi:hypothetical protein